MIDPKRYSHEVALKVANDANPEAAAWMRYMADRLADLERETCRFYFADGSFEELESPEAVRTRRIEAAKRLAECDELAAHAERMTAWIKEHGQHSDTCDILELDEQGCHKACSCGLDVIDELPRASLDSPLRREAKEVG